MKNYQFNCGEAAFLVVENGDHVPAALREALVYVCGKLGKDPNTILSDDPLVKVEVKTLYFLEAVESIGNIGAEFEEIPD